MAGSRSRSERAHEGQHFVDVARHLHAAPLLRERPVEARVAPGFTELDDAEEMMMRRQSWRDYRAQAKAAGDPNLLALLDAGVRRVVIGTRTDDEVQILEGLAPGEVVAVTGLQELRNG